jgi:TetR/AcrR family transcriptional regulator, transcriptional repressor for nem operon
MSQKTEQKLKSHEAILASAASMLREHGIKASSVAEVMKGAGLTVGGFYSHFDSKEALFTETIKSATGILWKQLLQNTEGLLPRERLQLMLRQYLSRKHRDNVVEGCLLPTVAPEVAREGEPYRGALEVELSALISSMTSLFGDRPEYKEKALALIALMFGALSLSRALKGTALSDEILQAAKKFGAQAIPEEPTPEKT